MNWIITASAIMLAIAIVISWLGSVRAPKATSGWFVLPAWAQIVLGFAAIAAFIYVGFLLWISLPLNPFPMTAKIFSVIGLMIYLLGLSLWFWARWALGATFGVSTSSTAPLQAGHRLIQRGPYAFVRHPMYLGYWSVLAGLTLAYLLWTPLLLLVMTLLSFRRRMRREEIALTERFGDEWKAYADRVPMFLPRWKKKSKEDNS